MRLTQKEKYVNHMHIINTASDTAMADLQKDPFQMGGSILPSRTTSLPPQPKTVRDTGLDRRLILELVAKTISQFGRIHLPVLATRLKLSINVLNEVLNFMVTEHLAEIVRRGATDTDVEYQLTGAGKQRAMEFMSRCRYVGPAPVTLDAYRTVVAQHSVRFNRVNQNELARAFADLTLHAGVRDQIGAALNSGRPLFLYGPAGSGKTYLAERLGRLMQGDTLIPYAIVVENEIIQVYDPLVHQRVEEQNEQVSLVNRPADGRWVTCTRPVVLTGGELTLPMLELRYDSSAGFYQAPPHFKANNGIFIVDDLGRQQVSPEALMNRWIVPLDRGCDHFSLHTGYKFEVPFDVTVTFSTNLQPSELADEAFLRRLGYKIHVGELSEEEYRSVFRQHSAAQGVEFDEAAYRYLIEELHRKNERPLLACYPRDLLRHLQDFASYYSEPPELTPRAMERAWHSYFAEGGAPVNESTMEKT